MKRIISAILLLVMPLTLLCGCKKEEDGRVFDYDDLSKYVTIGDYIGIEYTLTVEPVTQADVDSFTNDALSSYGYGTENTVTDRGIKNGDVANIDYVGKRDGVAFDGGTDSGYDLTIGSGTFIPGFEEGMIGMVTGETRVLDVTFPENYSNTELAGVAVQFEVTVNSIKETVYPELTDELVQEISDQESVADYVEYANAQVLATNQETAQTNAENSILESVFNDCTFHELPEREVAYFEELIIEQQNSYYESYYGMTLDAVLEQSGSTLDDIMPQITADAEEYTKNFLMYTAIARDQDIDVTDTQYTEALEEYAASNNYSSAKEAEKNIDTDQFYLSLLAENVVSFVVENAVESEA